ncbi:hypothetical protein ASD97_38780 [Streptomyces sp. Root63]|uniref:hypothetical protein n=1 Tax=Streptomyces TaxID=1883 RepID=UPI0006FC2DA5|nr:MULTISPECIES: hypothetical protein [unclassified Streptomyces]KQX26953.1 hypothetical protein ASD29_31670 [Streptomyces sp. Root1295]KRA46144.1 hypothetical protein ASD97_38780 [Streptomyces sp. Root63]MBT1099888.1 hypothetical protein [Streptomyces sp. Tu10]WUD86772.1 hypothetical protein OG703_00905 [Streptomyces anulatus]
MPERRCAVTRVEDGTVRIAGPSVGPAFTRAVLEVAGAVLTWPVLGPAGLPAAEIHDVGQAQQWLWAVYGERAAAAVDAVASGTPTAELTLPERPTALAGSAARLALGHWTADWWPTSYLDGIPALEPDVLGLELAALTHECQQLLHESAELDGLELLEEHLAALDPLIRWRQSADPPRRLDRVLRLTDDAADNAGLDGEALRHLRSALDQDHRPTATPLDLAELFLRHKEFTLAAGALRTASGRVIARGSGTNDWCRYPPGFVDAAENAVSWTAYALGADRRIEVEVVAGIAAPVGGVHLAAEVHVDGSPPNRVPLARRDDVWTGRVDLDIPASTTPSMEVGILLPGFDPGPGADHRAAREAVRGLARHRLGVATAPHDSKAAHPEPFLAEIAAAAAAEEDF